MIGHTISHYKVTAKLGEGGMGEVYLATDTTLDRQVALKFLPESLRSDSEARARLVREAKAASKLNHPNILTIHSVEDSEGRDFIVMEYVEGKNLSDYLASRSTSLDERLSLMIQIAEGIGKAHAAAVFHRDIKPSNILVDSDGRARVLDFGLATFQGAVRLTQIGSTVGTAAYMSPEQAGNRECDQRSDIFSLGVVLYEMVCGRLPFQGGHSAAIMYAILNDDPEPMARYASGVTDELQRIVSKCLAKHAGERYQSAADLIADLKRLIRLSNSGSTPAATPRRRMLAVLPFENLGAADDEYFADGITEEIISRLASVNGLGVISRTSAMQYKRTRKSIREIGAELSVDFILEGSVRWSRGSQGASRVRITPQLIRVTEDTHMWSERYDRVIEDIFDVQSEIAEKVTAQLNVALGEPERQAMEVKPTENMDAYYAYLRGLEYIRRPDYSPENHRLAIQMFERACQLDGSFAQAHAYLAITHSGMYFYGYDRTDERREKSAGSVERAVALKPGDPDTHLALGFHHYRCHSDLDRAFEEFTKVLQLQPNQVLPLFMTAMIHRRQGRFRESLDLAKNVLLLDPLSASFALEAGITALIMRRYDEAEQLIDRSISLSPDQVNAYTWKAMLNLHGRGDIASAWRSLEGIGAEDQFSTFWEKLELLLAGRDLVAALAHVNALTVEVFEDQNLYYPKPLLVAEVLALLGDPTLAQSAYEEAFALLEKAAAEKPRDARVHIAIAHACVGLNRPDEAFRHAQEAVNLVPMEKDTLAGPGVLFEQARIHARAGDHTTALQVIEYLLSIPSWISPASLKIGVYWDPLRNSPEFQRLVAQAPKVF